MARRAKSGVSPRQESDSPPASEEFDFDALFRKYARYVGSIGLKILGTDDELDDLVQEVFLAAHRGLKSIQDSAAIKSWLVTVTVRTAQRRLRRQWLKSLFGASPSVAYERLADRAASPEQRAQLAGIYRRLERLPPALRVAWVLRFVEGEPLERIAAACRCSQSTVQRRLRVAQAFVLQVPQEVEDEEAS